MIFITFKKIIIGNTQQVHDVPGTFPEDPLKVLTSRPTGDLERTLRGPIRKLMILWKNCFSEAIALVLHIICFCFIQEEKIFCSSKRGRPRDVYRTQTSLGRNDRTFYGRPWDVVSNTFFKLNSKNILNLLWQVTQDLIVNASSEKSSEQYSG